MISGPELALWLAVETGERADALGDLVESGDLTVVIDDAGCFGLIRAHHDPMPRILMNGLPMMAPPALA